MSWRTTVLIGLAIGVISGLAAYITLSLVDAELRKQPHLTTSIPLDFAMAFDGGGLSISSLGDFDTSTEALGGLEVIRNYKGLGLNTYNPQGSKNEL